MWTSAPWRRAPWLLLRRPGVLASVAGATVVLVASVASVPLFLSSVRTEAVALQVGERCAADTGVTIARPATAAAVTAPVTDPFASVHGRVGPTTQWFRMESIWLESATTALRSQTFVLAEDGALDRIEVVARADDPRGVWISDRATELTGLGAGDVALLGGASVPIAGVYRDLSGSTIDPAWCAHGDMLSLRGQDLESPPPVVLAPRAVFAEVMASVGADEVASAHSAPLAAGLTVSDASALMDDLACTGDRAVVSALSWCADGRPGVPVPARGRPGTDLVEAPTTEAFVAGYFDTSLPFLVARATATGTSVAGGIWPVAGLAALAGAGLVAAAASVWFERRRAELWLLTVRGAGPVALGAKAVLEVGAALAGGAVVGHVLARRAVGWLGPSPHVERSSVDSAVAVSVVAVLLAAVIVAVVVAARTSGLHRGRGARWARLVPWELGVVGATVVSYERLGRWGVPVGSGAEVTKVDVWGLLFPVLFLLAVIGIAVRGLSALAGPLRRATTSSPIAIHLAARRVARYRVAVAGLAAASAVAAGVLGYAATLNRSLDAGLDAKARTFVGSDVAVRIPPDAQLPPDVDARATEVGVHRWAWLERADRPREEVSVLAIDPSTFGRAVPGIDVDALGGHGDQGDRIPAIVVGAAAATGATVQIDRGVRSTFELDVVDVVDSVPGARRATPTIFVAADALPSDQRATATEAWIAGDREEILAALRDAGVPHAEPRSTAEIVDGAAFLTVTWTFGFMQTLGVAAGLLVLGGAAVHLDARRRRRVLAYALARRMGLTGGQHGSAIGGELAAGIVVGCWLGLAAALAGAALAVPRLDPVPSFDPRPLLEPATVVVGGLGVAAIVLTVLAAIASQRATERADVVEVLRAGA